MKWFVFATAAAIGLCAGAQSPPALAQVAATSPAAPTSAADYVRQAALSDMYEIQAGELAQTRAASPAVKRFAQQMVTDHTATTNSLKAALASANLPASPPTSLDPRRTDMLRQLQSASGPGFDRLYLQQQAAAHDEALALHSGYAQSGDNPPLRTLAGQVAQKVQSHIDMLKQISPA